MSAAERLLDRLDRPKPTGPGRWVAGCPCCQSRHGRPISVRALDDGRVLLHAFCGCEKSAVLGALGLQLADLFEKPLAHHLPPSASRIPARDLLETIAFEVDVAAIILADVVEGRGIGELGWSRLAQAAARIGAARAHIAS